MARGTLVPTNLLTFFNNETVANLVKKICSNWAPSPFTNVGSQSSRSWAGTWHSDGRSLKLVALGDFSGVNTISG